MTWLDFALSRTAARDWREGDRILVSRLDHDGGVAPWVELAADRGFELEWVDVTRGSAPRLRRPRRTGSTTGFVSSPASARRTRSARSSTSRGCRSSRTRPARCAGSTPCSTPRTCRPTCRRSAATSSSPPPTSSAGRISGSPTAGTTCSSLGARTRRVPPRRSRSAAASRSGTAPYELLAGFSATLAYLESIGGMEAIAAYERELGRRFLDGLPDGATVYGLQTMDGRVPTFLINLEGVDAVDAARTALGRGLRRLGARQLVLARAAGEAPVPGQRDPRRSHSLQHRRRDRPLQRRARPTPVALRTHVRAPRGR